MEPAARGLLNGLGRFNHLGYLFIPRVRTPTCLQYCNTETSRGDGVAGRSYSPPSAAKNHRSFFGSDFLTEYNTLDLMQKAEERFLRLFIEYVRAELGSTAIPRRPVATACQGTVTRRQAPQKNQRSFFGLFCALSSGLRWGLLNGLDDLII